MILNYLTCSLISRTILNYLVIAHMILNYLVITHMILNYVVIAHMILNYLVFAHLILNYLGIANMILNYLVNMFLDPSHYSLLLVSHMLLYCSHDPQLYHMFLNRSHVP